MSEKYNDVYVPSDVRKYPENEKMEAYQSLLTKKQGYTQDSLDMRISAGIGLTEKELNSLSDLLGKGCRQEKKLRIRRTLANCPYITSYGIFGRVLFSNDEASYCAGQSYPDEIRTVRECLVGR
jgi:hypothetical protein